MALDAEVRPCEQDHLDALADQLLDRLADRLLTKLEARGVPDGALLLDVMRAQKQLET